MIVTPDGRAFVGGFGYDMFAREAQRPTVISTDDPDGTARVATDDVVFPNGMALINEGAQLIVSETVVGRISVFDVGDDGVLGARSTFAEIPGMTPDGICADAEGAMWVASPGERAMLRVRRGGEVAETIETGLRMAIACVLGGPDRRTLHVITAETLSADKARTRRSGRLEVVEVDVPGAGDP